MNAQPPVPPDDDEDASDWLASQFDPTGQVPAQKPAQPVQPAQPQQPPVAQPPVGQPPVAQPPAAQPPVAQPPVQQPAQPVLPPQFPVQPGTPMQARPPQQPQAPAAQPPVQQPPVQQPPVQQPPVQQPPVHQPPAHPPAAQQPPAQQGGFSWGLTPGADQPVTPAPPVTPTPPVTPAPPVTPPATPPAATPPAAPPPPAAPAGTWFDTLGQQPAQQPAFPPAQPRHPEQPHDPAPLDAGLAGTPPESQPPAAPMPFETGVLPDVAPDARDAPPFWEPEPTQMMDALELEPDPRPEQPPKQPFTRSVFPEGTELLPEQPAQPAFGAPAGETSQISALDALFGETQFKEYEAGLADPNQNPFARREVDDPAVPGGPGGRRPQAGVSRLQKTLLIVLGSALAVIALIGLFFLGIRLPALLGPAPAVTAPSASPSPSATAEALGPVAPGTYHYDELLGGECIDPYTSPWQDEYTVIDCATPHAAQMVRRGDIAEDPTLLGVYPGEDVLQIQVLKLCRVAGIFSSASSKIKDGVVAGSYPTEEQWDEGTRSYYCFVTRSSGEPLPFDIALPQKPKPTPTPTPTPGG